MGQVLPVPLWVTDITGDWFAMDGEMMSSVGVCREVELVYYSVLWLVGFVA